MLRIGRLFAARKDHGSCRASGIERRAVPETRREDAGYSAGEDHDDDARAAARGDVQGPRVEGLYSPRTFLESASFPATPLSHNVALTGGPLAGRPG